MNPADPFAVVKECKGAALAILVLLGTNQGLGGGAFTQEWLERHSGYTDKPVGQALAYLGETGLIRRTSVGWVLAAAFPAPGTLPEAPHEAGSADDDGSTGPVPAGVETPPETQPAPRPDPLEPDESRKFSDSPTTAHNININLIKAEEERGVGIIPTRINLELVEANLAAFKKWGVGRNEKRSCCPRGPRSPRCRSTTSPNG